MDKTLKKIAIIIPVIILIFTANFGSAHEYVQIDYEQLGIEEEKIGMLPNNFFYFLKEWDRGFSLMLTGNSEAKAKKELAILNEKAAEVFAVGQDSGDVKGIVKALKNYGKSSEKIIRKVETLNHEEVLEILEKHSILISQVSERYAGSSKYEEINNLENAIQSHVIENISFAVEKGENAKSKSEYEISILKKGVDDLQGAINSIEITFTEPSGVQATSGCNRDFLPECGLISGKTTGFVCINDKWSCAHFPDSRVLKINENLFNESGEKIIKEDADTLKVLVQDDVALNTLFQVHQNAQNVLNKSKNGLAEANGFFSNGKYGQAYGISMLIGIQTDDALRKIEGLNLITKD